MSHRYFFNSFISLNTYNIINQDQFREFVAKAPFVSGTTNLVFFCNAYKQDVSQYLQISSAPSTLRNRHIGLFFLIA